MSASLSTADARVSAQAKAETDTTLVQVDDVFFSYGGRPIYKGMSLSIPKGKITAILGPSGTGKTTLLRLIGGQLTPDRGHILFDGIDVHKLKRTELYELRKRMSMLFQSGALFSSMTLAENIALPLQQYSTYSKEDISYLVSLKLALVGLAGFEDFYPSEISGGMKKRAGLARALALDPEILYFDEPSAGLDPVSSRLLDNLMMDINQSLGTTLVVVTHELDSIFTIAKNAIFIDATTQTISARGNPHELLKNPPNENIYKFLTRGKNHA